MLTRYLDHEYPKAPPTERVAFARLLECADPKLQEMFLEARLAPDEDMEAVARKIRASSPNRG